MKIKCSCGHETTFEEKDIISHRLLCGDSTDAATVERLMDGKKADLVFTDPPYGMNLDTDWSNAKSDVKFYTEKGCKRHGNKYNKIIGDNIDYDPAFIFNNFEYCKEFFLWGADYYSERLLNKNKGSWIVWDKRSNENTEINYVKQLDKMFGSCFELCWSKNNHKREIVRIKWAGIFGTEKEPDKDKSRKHPTQKPVLLVEWFLNKYSQEFNICFDPFLGSGSTLIACEKTNRICYGMEIDPHYCDVVIQRYVDYTGNNKLKRNGVDYLWEKRDETNVSPLFKR